MAWQFDANYPGITKFYSCKYVTSLGISPGMIRIACHPNSTPAAGGTLIFGTTDGATTKTVTLRDCKVVDLKGSGSAGGREVYVEMQDRRWRWLQSYPQFGMYNQADAHHKLIPTTVRSLYQMAVMLLTAMGEPVPAGGWETVLDVPPGLAVPADATLGIPAPASWDQVVDGAADFLKCGVNFTRSRTNPITVWTATPAAVALAQMLEQYGRAVALNTQNDTVSVVRIGTGLDLPAGRQLSYSPALSLDTVPSATTVLGSPTRYQMRLRFRAVGQDWDGDWKPLERLSYAPELPGPGQAMIATAEILDYDVAKSYILFVNGVRFSCPAGSHVNVGTVISSLATDINASTDPRVSGKVTTAPFLARLKLTGAITPVVGYEFKVRADDATYWRFRPIQGPIPSPTAQIHRQTVEVTDPNFTFLSGAATITVNVNGTPFSSSAASRIWTVSVTGNSTDWDGDFVANDLQLQVQVDASVFVSTIGDDLTAAILDIVDQIRGSLVYAVKGVSVVAEGFSLTLTLNDATVAVSSLLIPSSTDFSVDVAHRDTGISIPEALDKIATAINADVVAGAAVQCTAQGRLLALDGVVAGATVAVTASVSGGNGVAVVGALQLPTTVAKGFHLCGRDGNLTVGATDRLNYNEARAAAKRSVNRCYQLICEDPADGTNHTIPLPVPLRDAKAWKIDFTDLNFNFLDLSGVLQLVIDGTTMNSTAGLALAAAVSDLADSINLIAPTVGYAEAEGFTLYLTAPLTGSTVVASVAPVEAGTAFAAKVAGVSVIRRNLVTLLNTRIEQVMPRAGDATALDPRTLGQPYALDVYNGYSSDRAPATFAEISVGCFDGIVFPVPGGMGFHTLDNQQIYIPFTIIDAERQVIQFERPIYRFYGQAGTGALLVTLPADPVIEIGALVCDPATLVPYRYGATVAIPGATAPPVVRIFDDIQQELIGIYDAQHVLVDVRLNDADAEQRALLYATETAQKYQQPASQTITYSGLEFIGIDGKIRQVEWSFDRGQHSTTASENSEFSKQVPPWGDRRRAENMPPNAQRTMENLMSSPFFRGADKNIQDAIGKVGGWG